jgi:phage-related protein
LIQTIKNIVAQIKDAWNSAKDTVTNFSSNAMSKAKSLLSFG